MSVILLAALLWTSASVGAGLFLGALVRTADRRDAAGPRTAGAVGPVGPAVAAIPAPREAPVALRSRTGATSAPATARRG